MATESLAALAARVGDACRAHGLTLATAESCTGGLIADALTDIPGSSDYVVGGVVSYANAVKVGWLGVEQGVIEAHGAVSAQVARAMALGARERFGVALAVAVTGVAGPGGGTDAKPVGLTYIAVASDEGVEVERHQWAGSRVENKQASAEAALGMLLAGCERVRGQAGGS